MNDWKDFLCKDCKVNTHKINEYYGVKDSIWKLAKGGKSMLCVGCLEVRIGRKLTPEDFSGAPINFISPQSERLSARFRNAERDWHRTNVARIMHGEEPIEGHA